SPETRRPSARTGRRRLRTPGSKTAPSARDCATRSPSRRKPRRCRRTDKRTAREGSCETLAVRLRSLPMQGLPPPPWRGRVGGGAPQPRGTRVGLPPPLTLPRKGGGKRERCAVRNDVGVADAATLPPRLWWREPTVTAVNSRISFAKFITSPVRRVEFDRFRNLALPAVAIGEKFRLVIKEFLAGLGREFEIRPLDDGIDRTGLLAQSAIDALHHVDVVAHGAAGAVVAARTGLDGDRLRRTDRLAQLAGDAAFLAIGIAAQRMLTAEPRGDRPFLDGIIQRRLRLEEVAHGEKERRHEFGQQ